MTLQNVSPPQLLQQLEYVQEMVELTLQSLNGIKNQIDSSKPESSVMYNEKSELEGKLMKFYAKQMVAKLNSPHGILHTEPKVKDYPPLRQFLQLVEISDEMIKEIIENRKTETVEQLCLFPDEKIRGIFYSHNDDQEEELNAQYKRLTMSLKILRNFINRLQNGEKSSDLKWNGWFDTVPDNMSPNIRASLTTYLSVFSYPEHPYTPFMSRSIPPSPNPSRNVSVSSSIPRSQSDEANIGHRTKTESTSSAGSSGSTGRYGVRKNRPNNLIIHQFEDTDSDYSKSRSSSISQSPRTPNSINPLNVKHKFSGKQLLVSMCDFCERVMVIGIKCKMCGFKCHKKCGRKVPARCSVDRRRVDMPRTDHLASPFARMKRTKSEPYDTLNQIDSKVKPEHRSHGNLVPYKTKPTAPSVGSSSTTSSRSASSASVASSPFPSDQSPGGTPADPDQNDRFQFHPDSLSFEDTFISTNSTVSTIKSDASTDTLIMSQGSSKSKSSNETRSSENTIPCEDDCACAIDELHTQISNLPPHLSHVKLRGRGSLISEWVIPYQEIEVGDLIGKGRVGRVYKAKWHGEVALKVLYLENPSIEEKNDFKYKVQMLRRTRHENLILFMGACMEPPTLAIVCSLCKGYTLYQHIHIRNDKFDDAKILSITQQTAQAMSYLHARSIVHCDLKSKNIFLEHNKIVITDFGLISAADVKVANSERPLELLIPHRWLPYQAPEIIKGLTPHDPGCEVAHYSKESDVYAFGTVWYELLSGKYPFHELPCESVIWMIGKGCRQNLDNLEISREAKDILSLMWHSSPESRPPFKMILKAFERLPKKKLFRSPSQPTYLTRTANALILYP